MDDFILRTEHLEKIFTGGENVHALNDISVSICKGEILGVVGESGSGKSTLARAVTRLMDVDSGDIWLCGENITNYTGRHLRDIYGKMQMVFQDSVGSFDPRISVGRGIEELLESFTNMTKKERREESKKLLEAVGLKREYHNRLPIQLSGGECQRAAIARAIAVKPKLLICDEITSALDVSMQAQIVDLIRSLADELKMAVLFISHDLALVNSLCHTVAVMYHGAIVETGDAKTVITNPQDDYTKRLKASVFAV